MDSALLQADKNGKIYLDPTKGRMGALKSAVSDLKSAQGASGGGGLAACRENCRKRCEEKRAASAGTSTRRMDHEDMKNCEESCISSNCRASNFEEGTYRVGATRIKRVDVQQIIREELRAVLAERKKV